MFTRLIHLFDLLVNLSIPQTILCVMQYIIVDIEGCVVWRNPLYRNLLFAISYSPPTPSPKAPLGHILFCKAPLFARSDASELYEFG